MIDYIKAETVAQCYVDDEDMSHSRMDIPGNGGILSYTGRQFLGLMNFMDAKTRFCLLAVLGLFVLALPSVLSCSESKQPDLGKNLSQFMAPDFRHFWSKSAHSEMTTIKKGSSDFLVQRNSYKYL